MSEKNFSALALSFWFCRTHPFVFVFDAVDCRLVLISLVPPQIEYLQDAREQTKRMHKREEQLMMSAVYEVGVEMQRRVLTQPLSTNSMRDAPGSPGGSNYSPVQSWLSSVRARQRKGLVWIVNSDRPLFLKKILKIHFPQKIIDQTSHARRWCTIGLDTT